MNFPTVLLGEVASTIMGQAPPGKDCNKEGRGTIFVKAGEFDDRRPLIREWTTRPLRMAAKGDVLVCVVGATAGKINLGIDCAIGRSVAAVRPKSGRIDTNYLHHFLVTETMFLRRRSQGLAQGVITREMLEQLPIPLPPLRVQRRIAATLDEADEMRRRRRQALERLNDLPRAMFLEMFGHPVTNSKQWATARLRELGRVSTGATPPGGREGMFGGNVPFVTPGDLGSGEAVQRTVTAAGAAASRIVRANSALVCCIGATIGKMDKARNRSAFNQQINAVEWSEEVDDEYGYQTLTFFKEKIAAWGASTTLPILKKSSFEEIKIPVPPLKLQRALSRPVAEIDKLKGGYRAHLAKLDGLFACLQDRAFRGEL